MPSLSKCIQIIAIALFALTGTALANTGRLTPDEAMRMSQSGKLLIVDIRDPEEWRETGIGKGVQPISIHQRGFLDKLDRAMGNDKSKPVGLICATGARSAAIQRELQKRGYSNIYDVSQGMLGNRSGPGWIRMGLPVEALK